MTGIEQETTTPIESNGATEPGSNGGNEPMTDQTSQGETLARMSDDLAAAVTRAGSGIVTVHARRRMPASGIVWSADGLVVTANHVVERDEEITVGLPDGRDVTATLVGRDQGTDLALLKTDATELTPTPHATSPAKIGHFVLAVARPGPSGPMASFGIVSVAGGAWRTSRRGTIEGVIRADVAMLPGFSGGALVNARGEIIGLNSSTLDRGGGLTIPVAAIQLVVDALQTHGKIRHGFLGIGAQAVHLPATLVQANDLPREHGLLVVAVEPNGPAEREGVMIGDIIVTIDGEPVSEVEELQDRLSGERVGRSLPIRLVRGGTALDLTVTVGERQ